MFMNIYYVYFDNCITLLNIETFTYESIIYNFDTHESNAWEIFSSFFKYPTLSKQICFRK